MDPLSLTAALLAVVQLTNSSAKIISMLSTASHSLKDDRYDELYWRIFAEKQSLIALVTQIQTSGRPLSPENVKTFHSLLSQLKVSHTKMEDALQRLIPDVGCFTLRSVANRLRFETGGFDELKQRMSSIEAMTRALKLLGETLPGYTPRTGEQSSATPTNSRASMATDRATMDDIAHAGDGPQDHPVVRPERGSRDIPLASLCRLCEEVMMELSSHPKLHGLEPKIFELLARFELWSLGVWDSRSGLMDMILKADPERHEVIGTFVTRSLVDIAVALEDIYRAAEKFSAENAEQWFSKSRRAIQAALGTGNLVDAAIERWSVLSMLLDDDEAALADADTTRGPETSSDSPAVVRKAPDSAISSALKDIESAVEGLFSINSSIRSIRRSYRLDMESAEAVVPMTVGSAVGVDTDTISLEEQPMSSEKQKEYLVLRVVSKDKAAQKLMREETVQLVKRLEEALNNDEGGLANTADPGVASNMRLLSPEVKTQRLRLEEFEKQSCDMPPEKLKAAVDLNRTLRETVNIVIVGDKRDVWGKCDPLLNAWETDKILDRTLETLGSAVATITQ